MSLLAASCLSSVLWSLIFMLVAKFACIEIDLTSLVSSLVSTAVLIFVALAIATSDAD